MTILQHLLKIRDQEVRQDAIHNYFSECLRAPRSRSDRENINIRRGRQARSLEHAIDLAFNWSEAQRRHHTFWRTLYEEAGVGLVPLIS